MSIILPSRTIVYSKMHLTRPLPSSHPTIRISHHALKASPSTSDFTSESTNGIEGLISPETTGAVTGPKSQSICFLLGAKWKLGMRRDRTISRIREAVSPVVEEAWRGRGRGTYSFPFARI